MRCGRPAMTSTTTIKLENIFVSFATSLKLQIKRFYLKKQYNQKNWICKILSYLKNKEGNYFRIGFARKKLIPL